MEHASRQPDVWDRLPHDHHLCDPRGGLYRLRPPHRYTFGRGDEVNFQFDDRLASRQHAELRYQISGNKPE